MSIRYKILMDSDPSKLAADVEKHSGQGWKLHGPLLVQTIHASAKANATGNTGGAGGKGGSGGDGGVVGGSGGEGGAGGTGNKVTTTQTEYETIYIQAMVK